MSDAPSGPCNSTVWPVAGIGIEAVGTLARTGTVGVRGVRDVGADAGDSTTGTRASAGNGGGTEDRVRLGAGVGSGNLAGGTSDDPGRMPSNSFNAPLSAFKSCSAVGLREASGRRHAFTT